MGPSVCVIIPTTSNNNTTAADLEITTGIDQDFNANYFIVKVMKRRKIFSILGALITGGLGIVEVLTD